MLKLLFRNGRWRRAGVVVAGTAIAVAAGLATRQLDSIEATAAVLAGACGFSLAALLLLVDRSEAKEVAREAGLRRIRQYGERLAIYDRETGLYAYWYFSLRLEEEMARSKRYGQPLAVTLIESTRVRLTPGEEQHLFSALIDSFRTSDIVAHLGNLRFVALLTNTDADGALVALRRLRDAAAPINVHVGMASYPHDGDDWESLLRAAGASSEAILDAHSGIASVRREGWRQAEAAHGPARAA